MKPRFESQQFPAYMSEYYKEKEENEETLNIVSEDTNDSVFHKKAFSICDIIGNFGDGFIVVHYEGYLYLVDQHAASEKSLFLQYLINPVKKYSTGINFMTFLPNYYRSTLEEKYDVFDKEGWSFEIMEKKAESTLVKVTRAPQVFNKSLQEEDFLFFVEKLYN